MKRKGELNTQLFALNFNLNVLQFQYIVSILGIEYSSQQTIIVLLFSSNLN